MTPFLSIILPLHNEVDRLPGAVEKITSQRWPFEVEIIAVENGSSDETYELGRFYAVTVDNFYIHSIPGRGKGAAVREGMLVASGEWCYMADVDFSTPVECVESFLQAAFAQRVKIVIGSRELAPDLVQVSFKRRLVGRMFHLITSAVVPGILDTQCGFKLFEARAAKEIFSQALVTGMAFDVEALYLARCKGYEVIEMPVPWTMDRDSRVNLLVDGWQMLRDVAVIKMNSARRKDRSLQPT